MTDAKSAALENPLIGKILDKQNDDGSWGEAERFYLDKYQGTVWRLLLLAELGADPSLPKVIKACEFILRHSQDPIENGFSALESAKTHSGLSSGVNPCLTGNMVYSLIKLGFLHDGRVWKAIDWIVKYQRTDDGGFDFSNDAFYQRYPVCFGNHSCHMGVAKAFKALAAIPEPLRNDDIKHKISEFSEYFLIHHLYKKSHQTDAVSKPGWLRLGFPLMYQTDILELLGIFADLKIHDPRLDDALAILKSLRNKDGVWILQNTLNGKMAVTIGEKGKPSKWITFKALKILKEYETV